MEGRWGRRIFGRIFIEGGHVWFWLEMETQEDECLLVQIAVDPFELERYPSTYGQTLDRLVYEMEKLLNRRQNTP